MKKIQVRMEPSHELSELLGYPYYVERSFSLDELRKKGIVDEGDIAQMERGYEIEKRIPLRLKREG